jgi:hypothetical protein
MKKFFNSTIGKCFLYTLLSVGVFVMHYGIIWFIQDDFNWIDLSEKTGRIALVWLVTVDIIMACLISKLVSD